MKIDINDPKKILDIAAKLPPDVAKEFTKTYFQIQELDKKGNIQHDFMGLLNMFGLTLLKVNITNKSLISLMTLLQVKLKD